MVSRNFAYIRCSTKQQSEFRQLDALKGFKIDPRDIYVDKASGRDFNRPEWAALKRTIRDGDTLFIKSLDRLGRNKKCILQEWDWLIKNNINIVVLDMPLLDTRKYDELDGVGSLITNLVLEILTWLSEEEFITTKIRQREGIESSKKRGMKFGRPKINIDNRFKEVYFKWKTNNITAVEAMGILNMKKNTFYRRVKEFEKNIVKS